MSVVLSEHLPLLASAPDGIQKLRGLILELAVRGKLVPQDPNDEPASELIERIAQERVQLETKGICKKSKPTPPVSEDEQPFVVPEGWEWSRLSVISIINPRNLADDSTIASFVPMAMIGTSFDGSHSQEHRKWGEIKQGFTHFAEDDIGVAKITPCFENSKACVFENLQSGIGAGTTELHIVRPIGTGLVPRYVLAYLKAPTFLQIGETRMTGTAGQKRLPKEFVEQNPFPLPPLAEQHRIVAKVDELMSLCDRLETEQTDAEAAHAKLVKTLLGTLTQSTNAAELAVNWQRLSEHFDTLFTTESSLDALKQTILQLAVMGKLVPQDPDDEPASELLKRIGRERARLEAKGTCKKPKTMPPVGEDEQPFAMPSGWKWTRFDEIVSPNKPIAYGVLVPGPDVSDGVPFVRIADLSVTDPPDLPEKTIDKRVDSQYERTRLDGGEILMGVVGSIGKLGMAPMSWKGANIARAICRIVPTQHIEKSFVLMLLQSQFMQSSFVDDTRTLAQPTLNVGLIRSALTPIPPLAEQHRIVAKVDELMALCDRLKADLVESRSRQARLSATLIESALQTA